MSAYNKKIQFISLPELTTGLSINKSTEYLLKDALIKMQAPVEYKIEVEDDKIFISNSFVSSYMIIIRDNVKIIISRYTNYIMHLDPHVLHIFSDNIKNFIEVQLSGNNDTIFIPKLV